MTQLHLELITPERTLFDQKVDMVVAPGVEGELGILPQHAPLVTVLAPGELRVKQKDQEIHLIVTGGFMHVRSDRVTVLADAAERAEEIDIDRAEKARSRAKALIKSERDDVDFGRAEAALRRATVRLKVARRRRRHIPRRTLGEDNF